MTRIYNLGEIKGDFIYPVSIIVGVGLVTFGLMLSKLVALKIIKPIWVLGR